MKSLQKPLIIVVVLLIGAAVKLDNVVCLKLVAMQVPSLADPRENLTLDCQFDMGTDELYSVKWYKDDQEFFRYIPSQRPNVLSFRVPGVYLANKRGDCTTDHCTVQLTGLTTSHSSGAYKCEVSTEGPKFDVAFGSTNVTVAAIGKENPKVEGISSTYGLGELVLATCISAPADPVPIVTWNINGEKAPESSLSPPKTFQVNSSLSTLSLVSRSVLLKFHTQKQHFSESTSTMEVQCVATTPSVKAPPLVTTVISTLHGARDHSLLSNQKLEWPNAADTIASSKFLSLLVIFSTCLRLKDIF